MKSNAGPVELCPPLDSLNDVLVENLKEVFLNLLLNYVALARRCASPGLGDGPGSQVSAVSTGTD